MRVAVSGTHRAGKSTLVEDLAERLRGHRVLDRCPLDLVAYARVSEDGDSLDLEEWMPRIRDAMETLHLVVFVPIEEPDRIRVGSGEDAGLRAAVDRELAAMLVDDALGLELEVVTVEGSRPERVAQVLRRFTRSDPTT